MRNFGKQLFKYGLVISLTVLLTACFFNQKDGPPPYPVDVSHVPDATPQVEPLARFGNYRSYVVKGKVYHVMRSSKNYSQVGIASWYGIKFHHQRTSSGERYNMLAMTAAHKTLPLPTYVKVTNLRNGRHVIVKVNDRGPFEGNRLIDLSYTAAVKLGMFGHGTTRVRVTAIDPIQYARNHRKAGSSMDHHQNDIYTNEVHSKGFYLKVGSFKQDRSAQQLKQKLMATTHSPIYIKRILHDRKHYYTVGIGPIKDKIIADSLSKKLQEMGLQSKTVAM